MKIGKAGRLAALAISGVLVLSACNPAGRDGGGTQPTTDGSGAVEFTKELSGTLNTSGFNPSDEVGKSRSDLAAERIAPVEVVQDTTNFDPQKFSAQVASGQTPDLIQVNRSMVGTLADRELIVPLDQCYDLWQVDPAERYYQAALDDVTYDGSLYAIPQFFQTSMIIANKRVMEQAGVTIDQLDTSKPDQIIAAAEQMYAESGGVPSLIGFDPDLPGSVAVWLIAFGGGAMEDNGQPALDQQANVEALTWLKQLVDAQGGNAAFQSFKQTMDVFGDQNQYVADQVGAQLWAQWYINVLANTKDDVSVEATPVRTTAGDVIGFAGGTAFAIPAGGKNPSAACAWAIEATSPDAWQAAGAARAETVAERDSINTGLFTGSPVADELVREQFVEPSGNADFDQLIATSYQTLENPVSVGGSAVGQEIDDALKNAVAQVLAGSMEPEAALQEAQATAMRAWDQSAIGQRG